MNGERKCFNCSKVIPNARFMQLSDLVGLSNYCSLQCLKEDGIKLEKAIHSQLSKTTEEIN